MDSHHSVKSTYAGHEGEVKVYPNGSLEFVSNSGSSPRTCCGPKLTSWDGGEVIGATVSEQGSSPSVHVYYCPEQVKGGKSVRHLKKAGPFYSEVAKQLAAEVRNANNQHGELQIGGKTVLAVVNPLSGKAKGVKVWSEAQELLEAAGVMCQSILTTHPGHATEEIAAMDLDSFACIIAVGGDGSVHEILQGLRRHLLMPKSFSTPICHLPGGSGNGLSATCALWNPVTAVHALIKGSVQAVDAASVFLASETVPRLSILGVQYGLLANLDLGTEHLRKLLGGERFTYGALREVAKWGKHKANVAFFKEPATETDPKSQHLGVLQCPKLEAIDEKADFGDVATWPEGWTVQQRDSIRYMNLSGPGWATLDAHLNPWANTSDGLWEFVWDTATTRIQGLKMILDTQAGTHDKSPVFEVERVSAFVIEPVGNTTFLTVDGEKVELERLSVEVHRKLVKFVHAPSPG